MNERTVIALDGVGKTFAGGRGGDVQALDDIALSVPEGSFVSLLGPSGCGKSTLLRILADIIPPTTGTVEINGKTPRAARLARDYGIVFQQPALLEWRSVLRNVELPLQIMGIGKAARREKARHMLELVRLGDFARHFPWQLSGGMQQRVAVARALTFDPRILLMDEPLGALDEMNREYLQAELLRIWRDTHTTVVFVTHSVAEAVFLSTEVVIMSPRPGRVAKVIPIDLPQPRTAETRTSKEFYAAATDVRNALHAVLADEVPA
ncbi:ABC transporter ATP-binding protein [Actinopolymorpha sp. B17G11]|uniref:ABC transporter ATP-binding protein n=1 Tax=Actinopolymorpha sp. B17G11 TaxID=3160861 RepID=UPI0032E39969